MNGRARAPYMKQKMGGRGEITLPLGARAELVGDSSFGINHDTAHLLCLLKFLICFVMLVNGFRSLRINSAVCLIPSLLSTQGAAPFQTLLGSLGTAFSINLAPVFFLKACTLPMKPSSPSLLVSWSHLQRFRSQYGFFSRQNSV